MSESNRTSAEAIVLVARSAIAALPMQELERLRVLVGSSADVTFALTEQGEPSLRAVVHGLRDAGYETVVLVPLLLPMEPAFGAFLTRTIQRWRHESPGTWPAIRIGERGPSDTVAIAAMLQELVRSARSRPDVVDQERPDEGGSIVPAIRRRVLVCMGGPCQAAGAPVIWGYYRNEEKRLGLRTAGDGAMSAKASCLGPCSLAPVVQVFPEGTWYGGVTEDGINRIIREHLIEGEVVDGLAYVASSMRQRIRQREPGA